MALTERLALLVTLDAKQAISGLEKVGKAAEKNLSKTDQRLDKVGHGMQKAGASMLAGAGLAAVGLYKAGQSAADLEQAVGGTEAVFKEASGTIDGFATKSAKAMGLSERAFREATTSIGGQLKALGFNQDDAADKAVELTGVAADLAATYGGTTAEAVSALGAAFRGEADPAERFNLRLNQNTVNAKAVALGLAESTSQVDAQAKAQATLALITEQSADAQGQFAREADSASGSMAIANAEFENAKAALGESVTPIIASVSGGLADLAGGFQSANEKSNGLVSKLATFGTVGLAAAGGLSFTVGKIISMRENLGPLVGKLRNAEGGLTKVGKAGAIVGVALAAKGLYDYSKSLGELTIDVDSFAAGLANLDEAGKDELDTFLKLAEGTNQLDDIVGQLGDTNVAAAQRLVDYAAANGLAADKVAELQDVVDQKAEIDVQATKDQQANSDAVAGAIGPTGELAGATEDLGGGMDGAATDAATLAEKIKAVDEAYGNLLDATLGQFDADLAYQGAINDTEDALINVQTALDEHGAKSEEYSRATLEAKEALLDQADAAAELQIKTLEANGVTVTAAEKQAIHKSALEGVRDTLAPGSALRTSIDGYIGQLEKVPATIRTKLLADAGGAFQTVNAFLAYIKAAGFTTPLAATATLGFKQERLLSGERAAGGPVASGGTYLVGERGPELLHMGGNSGSITPNHAIGMGGGNAYSITVNSLDPRSAGKIVVDAIQAYESSNGKSW